MPEDTRRQPRRRYKPPPRRKDQPAGDHFHVSVCISRPARPEESMPRSEATCRHAQQRSDHGWRSGCGSRRREPPSTRSKAADSSPPCDFGFRGLPWGSYCAAAMVPPCGVSTGLGSEVVSGKSGPERSTPSSAAALSATTVESGINCSSLSESEGVESSTL